ncbi:MAG TPA: hypothetical protein VIN38_02460 [Thiobacillus sp.]
MSSPIYRLEKLLKKVKRLRRVDENAVRNIIATTRELIESANCQSSYPVTALYCNWSLHTQVSASLTALRCLEGITHKILRSATKTTAEELLDFLSNKVFQTNQLRAEMLELFQKYGLTSFLLSVDHNWQIFASLLYSDLVGKRLKYPLNVELPPDPRDSDALKKAKRIYGRLSCAVGGVQRKMYRAAWISLSIDPWDERPEGQVEPVFHTNVQTFDNVTFVIKINDLTQLPESDDYALVVAD